MSVETAIRVEINEKQIASLMMEDRLNANAWNPEFINALKEKLNDLRSIQPKVLVLRGLPEIFSVGASRQNLLDLCDGRFSACDVTIPEILLDLPFPVIAAMEGHAVGGGLMMGVCCDMVVMARESRYGVTFMSLGLTPGMGCTTLLAGMVGPYLAAEMMFTGRNFRGSELAGHATLINHIVKRSDVLAVSWDLALQIADKSGEAISLLKKTLSLPRQRLLAEARLQEHLMHMNCFASPQTRKTIEENYLR